MSAQQSNPVKQFSGKSGQAELTQAKPLETDLALGKPIERAIRGGKTHSYKVFVQVGHFIHVVVIQKGVDVTVTLLDPNGKEIIKRTSLIGAYEQEPVSTIAELSGDYIIKVTAGDVKLGQYRITLMYLRQPTVADRTRLQAEQSYVEGMILYAQGDASSYAEAERVWEQHSFALWKAINDRYGEAVALYSKARVREITGYRKEAIVAYKNALALFRDSTDRSGKAITLTRIGSILSDMGEYDAALNYLNLALSIHRTIGNQVAEADTLARIGRTCDYKGEKAKSLHFLSQALRISRSVGNRAGEATTLVYMGDYLAGQGDNQKAIDLYNQSLVLDRTANDRDGESTALTSLGSVYDDLGERERALDLYEKALPGFQAVNDRNGVATAFNNIGMVYYTLGEYQKALDFYSKALPLFRDMDDLDGQESILINNAAIYDDIGEKQQALDSLNQALIVARKHADRYDEATSLNSMGVLLESLGEREKSLGAFNQATLLYHAMGRRDREAVTLTNSGAIYRDLGDRQQAINNYTKSLQMFRQIGDRDGEATTLSNIGAAKSNWGEKLQALDLYNQASAIQSQIGDRHGEAVSLNNIGLVNNELGFRQSAMGYFNLALADARALSNPLLEATVYGNLMSMNRDQQPAFSIFCGKQAVNMLQLLRGNIQRLDKQLQNDFLASNTGYYHDLADLLISQGRLPEAQQVLDLLKEQEYSDFVRGEKENTLGTLSLTPTEQQAESDYAKSSSQLVALGQQWSDLKKIKQRTPEQEQQYQQFSAQLDKANQSFADYLTHLYEVFGKNGSANKETADIKGQSKSLQQAIAKMPKTVALYTMAGEDKYRIIVITGSTMAAREYDIKAADLNKKVAAYLEVLHDPTKDPKPLALELYKILIGPVQSDLDQAQAATLVISLDGTLRYIPIEALYDGKKYMLEQYGIVTFTPASIPFLNDKPDISNLSAAALGISRQYEDDLNPLPSVEGELNDIVRDSSTKGANGVLPGSILLNSGFTETALEQQLDEQHPVVHIASHFVLKPGDDTQSYLLLSGKDKAGTGYHLTVADFRDNPKLSLSDTTLLTLSACETGVTSNASNGREVDGLAMTAQLKGAKSVISSLWPVNDSSTGLLMADFYKRWAEGGGSVMKVEALRQAQLDLLTGKIKPTPDLSDPNAPTSFVHPYYWAPFVLMGNWK